MAFRDHTACTRPSVEEAGNVPRAIGPVYASVPTETGGPIASERACASMSQNALCSRLTSRRRFERLWCCACDGLSEQRRHQRVRRGACARNTFQVRV
jgi:hypothetical protein